MNIISLVEVHLHHVTILYAPLIGCTIEPHSIARKDTTIYSWDHTYWGGGGGRSSDRPDLFTKSMIVLGAKVAMR